MKSREAQELKAFPVNRLRELLAQKREALLKFRFHFSSGKIKNVKEARELRKDIARIKTILCVKH